MDDKGDRMKYSSLSKRTAVFVVLLATAIALLACAVGGGSVSVIGTETPASNPTAVSTNTPHVAKTDTILDAEGHSTLSDGSIGLVRLTGYYHTWQQEVSVPVSERGATLTALKLTITTGNDDLRDTADVVIHYATAGDMTYKDIKALSGTYIWENGVTTSLPLSPVPPATTVGDIQSLRIVTAFTGAVDGDNWDVLSVKLDATFV